MNLAHLKVETALADESDQTQLLARVGDPATSPELIDETPPNEDTDRSLYRRSVAYFFFGFGCNQHSILTDEPTEQS